MGQRESFGLKSVIADHELLDKFDKDGKCIESFAFEYPDLGVMLEQVINEKRYDELIDYCKNDVIALNNIDNSLNLYMYFESIRFIGGSKITDCMFNSKIIEMLLLHEGIRPMPTRKYTTNVTEKFPGALVVTPVAGIHNDVLTVDVSSMYPYIMIGFNVNPDIDGIVVKAMKKIMELREQYRAMKKKGMHGAEALDSGTKAISNSFYGVLGSPVFRLYNKENALFVTSTGQDINRFIQASAKEIGLNTTYGDTDSCFVTPVNDSGEVKGIETYLNARLVEWCDQKGCTVHITLKAEKLFKRILFKSASSNRRKSSKKKYAGYLIWEEGKHKNELKYMGLELKRSDQANITKECLSYFLSTVLIDGNQQLAVDKVKTLFQQIRDGNVNILDISIPKAVRKVGYDAKNSWVQGIEYAKEHYNYNIVEGAKPRLIYLKHEQTICIDEDFDTTQIQHDIDWDHMAQICIRKKMESYLWSLNLDWNTVIEGQHSLDKWL
jgi:DNA polymerase I